MTRIVITGAGIVSAVGSGLAATEAALRENRDGLGRLTRFTTPRANHLPVGEIPGQGATYILAGEAIGQASRSAGLDPTGETRRAGLALGTTVGGMPQSEVAFQELANGGEWRHSTTWVRHECGASTAIVMSVSGLEGPALTTASACASSAAAIALAADAIRMGLTDTMLAGGADLLCRLTLEGFHALLALDPAGCRPFDRGRAGTSLGEGAAFLVLESEERARRRGATILAELAGYASTCDAHHPTAPHPDGAGVEGALRAAIASAGIEPSDVGYVNAHGTGTVDNDLVEGRALRRVFDGRVPPFSSTKRTFGHTLGASGAIEAVVSLIALRRGFLPGTAGCTEPDPACEAVPLLAPRDGLPRVVLSSSFGFGGVNTVLCLREAR